MKTKERLAPWQRALAFLLASGWTLTRIAARIGVTERSVQNWKDGIRPHPRSRDDLVTLADRERSAS